MSAIGKDTLSGSLSQVTGEDQQFDIPLEFVKSESLSAMLKVVRVPPPIFDGDQPNATQARGSFTQGGTAQGQRKLAAAGLVLELAQLVVRREQEIGEVADPDVKRGFDEVYRFLVHNELLRSMK